jgi:hypothetical protein
MYHDDPYDPTLETNFGVPGYAPSEYSEEETIDSRIKRNRKLAEDLKNEDTGYCKVKRNSVYGNPYSRIVDIELYSGSENPGSRIRGAITGTKFKEYRVGSSDEYLFFKVGLCTGEKGLRGNKIFFFDGPEQYEKQMNCTVDPQTKTAWAERNLKEMARRNK